MNCTINQTFTPFFLCKNQKILIFAPEAAGEIEQGDLKVPLFVSKSER